jgi:hypothetical protein
VLTIAAVSARSVALAGFGLDSSISWCSPRWCWWPGAAVLLGLVLNAALGWWWADPAAGYVLVCYAAREVREIF